MFAILLDELLLSLQQRLRNKSPEAGRAFLYARRYYTEGIDA